MNGGCRHPASISSIRILFLASIEHRIDRSLSLLTRSAVSVIIAIIRRPVSAAVVVCVRVLFLLAWMIISSGVARCLRVGVSVSYALQHANCDVSAANEGTRGCLGTLSASRFSKSGLIGQKVWYQYLQCRLYHIIGL